MVTREQISDRLARIETKLDAVLGNDADKEKRIRSLERWRWSHAVPAAAFLAILAKLGLPMSPQH